MSKGRVNVDGFDRDRQYWNRYYRELRNAALHPSDFAKEIVRELEPQKHLLELGCGNGRDSLFFLQYGLKVTAVDASDYAIDYLNQLTRGRDGTSFVCDDFVKCQAVYQMQYDYIYSRFTLHAIREEQEDELLDNVHRSLYSDGKLFIEARTIHDDLFGSGKEVEKNAFVYDGHFRRFIDVNEFREKLMKKGFRIMSLEEGRGFSTTKASNPVLMRCIVVIEN